MVRVWPSQILALCYAMIPPQNRGSYVFYFLADQVSERNDTTAVENPSVSVTNGNVQTHSQPVVSNRP